MNHHIKYPIMVLYCVFLHIFWGIMLLIDFSGGNITTLFDLSQMFGRALPFVLIGVGLMAAIPILRKTETVMIAILLVIPQQMVLVASATTAIDAMVRGSFADGIARSHVFLIADQGTFVLAAIFHTLALIGSYARLPFIGRE